MMHLLTVYTEVMFLTVDNFSPPFHSHYPSGHVIAKNMEGSFEQVFSETVTDGLKSDSIEIRRHMQNASEQYMIFSIQCLHTFIFIPQHWRRLYSITAALLIVLANPKFIMIS